jgi:hypothetical protein
MPPGAITAGPLGWTATAALNSRSKEKPNSFITSSPSTVEPNSSSTALVICTQVVAIMPPKVTYSTISPPTVTTAPQ